MLDPAPSAAKAGEVADIVRHAGGRIVGRTRLQKIAYLLEVVGLGSGFSFAYKHYGPYSEGLTASVRKADLLGVVQEQENVANWGGVYSVFISPAVADLPALNHEKELFVTEAANADSVELELAATAVFFGSRGACF